MRLEYLMILILEGVIQRSLLILHKKHLKIIIFYSTVIWFLLVIILYLIPFMPYINKILLVFNSWIS